MMLITDATAPVSVPLIRTLNQHNFNYLVLADDPDCPIPEGLRFQQQLPTTQLPNWVDEHQHELEFAFHLSTSAEALFHELWQRCVAHQIPLIFSTTQDRTAWVQQQYDAPFFWAGLLSDEAVDSTAPEQAKQLANACYHMIHHRTSPGLYVCSSGKAAPTIVS